MFYTLLRKNPNKRKLQQIAFNHSSDIDLRDYESLQKMHSKTIFFLSNWCYSCVRWSFTFQKESFRKNIKTNQTIDDKIIDEKLQYDINREAAKISALSSGKIDKYEYLTGEEILPSDQRRVIEQAKFTYSLLGKASEKQTKTIEDQGKKQKKAIEDNGEQLLQSNALAKKMIMILKIDYFWKKKNIWKNCYWKK